MHAAYARTIGNLAGVARYDFEQGFLASRDFYARGSVSLPNEAAHTSSHATGGNLPEREAHQYELGFKRGQAAVLVRADQAEARAAELERERDERLTLTESSFIAAKYDHEEARVASLEAALREALSAFELMTRYARAAGSRAVPNQRAMRETWNDAQSLIERVRAALDAAPSRAEGYDGTDEMGLPRRGPGYLDNRVPSRLTSDDEVRQALEYIARVRPPFDEVDVGALVDLARRTVAATANDGRPSGVSRDRPS